MHLLKLVPLLLLATVLISGCASTTTNDPSEEVKMPRREQKACLSKNKPPEYFRYWVVSGKDGIGYEGNCRLHPQQHAVASLAENGNPIIEMGGRTANNTMAVLVDFSSPSSWMEFSTSQRFDTHFMGVNGSPIPYRGLQDTGGVNAYAAITTQLRIDQLFMENVPFFVRMAKGYIGPFARAIESPRIDAVLGYDTLANFEFIQFDFENKTIFFSTTEPCRPDEELLVGTAKIVRLPGHGLAIEGAILDRPTPVILDPVGDYSLSRGRLNPSITSKLSIGNLVFQQVPTLIRPSDDTPPHVGRGLLSPYVVTICPRQGVAYFERHFD